MFKDELKNKTEKVCDLLYLSNTMGGRKNLIIEIMDLFLIQISEELMAIKVAIDKIDYPIIKNFAHSMKSTVSILGISVLTPILDEIEELGKATSDIEKIILLNTELNLICLQAIEEVKKEKFNLCNNT